MQFHLRHLFLATAAAAVIAFAIANPAVGLPFALIAIPAGWRWIQWVGQDLPHFTTTDRALEIGFALFVSLIVEVVVVFWASLAAGATWLSILLIAAFILRTLEYDLAPLAFFALAPALVVYLTMYVLLYRETLRV